MTLIVGSALPNGFTLIGDLMLSGKSPAISQQGIVQDEIFLPTSGITTAAPCALTGNRVTSLAQKVCLIDKRLAVAWTGQYDCAVRVISHLRKRASGGYWTEERIRQSLGECAYEDLDRISMIALYYVSRGTLEIREWDADQIFDSKVVGACYAAGTGAKTFRDIANMFDRFSGNMTMILGDDHPLARVLLITGTLNGNQTLGRMYIDEHFGGAFEVVYAEQNRIKSWIK